MVPILYDTSETAFTSNGKGRLVECLSCEVTEERNGAFECEFTYPVDGRFYDDLISGGIIGVRVRQTTGIEPFDIYKFSVPINGVVTFNASHISYRLNDIIVRPYSATNAYLAMSMITLYSVVTNPFTFDGWDYRNETNPFNLDFMRSARGVLLGEEGSLLQNTHGEYTFSKWAVTLRKNRGVDRDSFIVRYGKDLKDITREKDVSGTFNAVAPYWTDGTTTVTLPEYYVQPTTPITPIKVALLDMSTSFEVMPTEAELRTAAVAYLDSNKPWEGTDTITVDFVALWQTAEYKNYIPLQTCALCDQVRVFWEDAGISTKGKIVKVVYNTLAERYDSLTIGTISNDYVVTRPDEGNLPTVSSKKYTLYSSVRELQQTEGSATIADTVSAMPDMSMLIAAGSQFSAAQVPSQDGIVRITKASVSARVSIEFLGKDTVKDYRMYVDGSGTPSGTWVMMGDRPIIATKQYSCSYNISANGYTNATAADLGISAPSGYSPIAIAAITTNDPAVVVRSFYARTSGTVVFMRNVSGSALTNKTLIVVMVFIRNDFAESL